MFSQNLRRQDFVKHGFAYYSSRCFTTTATTNIVNLIICMNRARRLILHANMMFNCSCATHIVMRSYRETVSFVNVSPIDAFDVFEYCEVFVLSIRALYALVLRIYYWKRRWSEYTI